MAEGRGLRRLAMGIGHDQGVSIFLRDSQRRVDQAEQRVDEDDQVLLQRQLEDRVVDVVAGPTGMQLAGDLDAEPALQLGLDIEEEVLVLAGIGECGHVDGGDDVVQRAQDRACLLLRQQAALGQHHRAGAVDPHLVLPVVALHAFEQWRQDRVLVDWRRKHAVVLEARHQTLVPLQMIPRKWSKRSAQVNTGRTD